MRTSQTLSLLRRVASQSRRRRCCSLAMTAPLPSRGAAAAPGQEPTAAGSDRPSAAAAPAVASLDDLDALAERFALSRSAALGLEASGDAADASLGPRIDHLIVGEGEEGEGEEKDDSSFAVVDLASFVSERSGLSRRHAEALLELGAVWWCPVPPPPPPRYPKSGGQSVTEEEKRKEEEDDSLRRAAELRHERGRETHGRGMHLFKPRRAGASDRPPRGSYVRVHVRPKRYFDSGADGGGEGEGGGKTSSTASAAEEGKPPTTLSAVQEGKPPTSAAPSAASAVGYSPLAWSRRIVALGPEFVVLNKPSRVPSVPTVDNGVEHALSGAAAGIAEVLKRRRKEERREGEATAPLPPRPPPRHRLKGPQATGEASTGGLAAAHRLDHGASGALAIGRTPRFVAEFQKASKRGAIAKVYRAAVAVARSSDPSSRPLPPKAGDVLVHWAEVNARPHGAPPRTLMFDGDGRGDDDGRGDGDNDKRERARCELRIVSFKRIELFPWAASALGFESGDGEEVWEACILLVTGRTHQIRAQMAKIGFPLLGDVLYGTDEFSQVEAPAKKQRKEERGKPLPLDRPIALHAARLAATAESGAASAVFGRNDGLPAVFDAGSPWWRSDAGEEDERELERALELRVGLEREQKAEGERGDERGRAVDVAL